MNGSVGFAQSFCSDFSKITLVTVMTWDADGFLI